ITAYWAGFTDYAMAGIVETRPRMLGFQAAGAAPIVEGRPIEKPETIATAIKIGNPATWAGAVAARDESHGSITAVTDDEILAVEVPGDRSSIDRTVPGDCVGGLPEDRSNRFIVALEAGLGELGFDGLERIGWKVEMTNPIPLERGLGSSAAATVAGLVAAG